MLQTRQSKRAGMAASRPRCCAAPANNGLRIIQSVRAATCRLQHASPSAGLPTSCSVNGVTQVNSLSRGAFISSCVQLAFKISAVAAADSAARGLGTAADAAGKPPALKLRSAHLTGGPLTHCCRHVPLFFPPDMQTQLHNRSKVLLSV